MIVVIEAVFAEVADVDIGPAVVVIVCNGYADTPALVRDASFFGDVGEGAVVIVVKERRLWVQGAFSVPGVGGGSVHQIDVEPAIVVVVDARANA